MTWKGQLFFEDKAEPEPRALPGSLVAFTRNGELQGVAYRRLRIHPYSAIPVSCHNQALQTHMFQKLQGGHAAGW